MKKFFVIFVLTLFVRTVFAQLGGTSGFVATSTGGGATAITSLTQVPGIIGWWDYSDSTTLWQGAGLTTAVTTNNDPIRTVTDKSGMANHLNVNVADAARPLWKQNILNGRGCALFDGSNDYNSRATFVGGTLAQPYCVFIVYKGLGNGVVFDGAGSVNYYRYVSGNLLWMNAGTLAQTRHISPDAVFKSTFIQYGFDSSWVRLNDKVIGFGDVSIGTNGQVGVNIGIFNDESSVPMNCYVGEVAVFSGYRPYLADSLATYSRTKWGIP